VISKDYINTSEVKQSCKY